MITWAFGVGIGIAIMLFFEYRYRKLYELEKECNKALERRIGFLESDNKYNDAILQNHCSRIGELEEKTSGFTKPIPKVTLTIDGVEYEVRGGYGGYGVR